MKIEFFSGNGSDRLRTDMDSRRSHVSQDKNLQLSPWLRVPLRFFTITRQRD
jgi:hypothetical protein